MQSEEQVQTRSVASVPVSGGLPQPAPSPWVPKWRDSVDWSQNRRQDTIDPRLLELGIRPALGRHIPSDDSAGDDHNEASSSNATKLPDIDTLKSLDEGSNTGFSNIPEEGPVGGLAIGAANGEDAISRLPGAVPSDQAVIARTTEGRRVVGDGHDNSREVGEVSAPRIRASCPPEKSLQQSEYPSLYDGCTAAC